MSRRRNRKDRGNGRDGGGDRESSGQGGDSSGNGQGRSKKDRSRQKGGGPAKSRANMIVLLDADEDYVEMESRGVVNYISGYNPMGFTVPGKARSYIENPRNEGRIALVLVDLEMPDLEGHSVLQIIESLRKREDAPVAVVSRSNNADVLQRVIDIGGVGFLPKAFTMEVFVRFVKTILRTGTSTAWQCRGCGKLAAIDQIDMLKMAPIKCSDRECGSMDLVEINFSPADDTLSTD